MISLVPSCKKEYGRLDRRNKDMLKIDFTYQHPFVNNKMTSMDIINGASGLRLNFDADRPLLTISSDLSITTTREIGKDCPGNPLVLAGEAGKTNIIIDGYSNLLDFFHFAINVCGCTHIGDYCISSLYHMIVDEKVCDIQLHQTTFPHETITPQKAHGSDVGHDLSAIGVAKQISAMTSLYETGVSVCPPDGYYVQILPRSSLSKSGYMLSNSVGIIDPSYRGTLKIALTKIDPSTPEIEFPFRCAQMVLCPYVHFKVKSVESLDITQRNDGGFGSSN